MRHRTWLCVYTVHIFQQSPTLCIVKPLALQQYDSSFPNIIPYNVFTTFSKIGNEMQLYPNSSKTQL